MRKFALVLEELRKNLVDVPLLDPDTSEELSKKKWILLRLCEQQNWRCFWCGCAMTGGNPLVSTYRTLEHVFPKTVKHKDTHKLSNLKAACKECNESRSDWSSNKGLSSLIADQKKIIDKLRTQRDDLNTALVLSDSCFWCRFKKRLRRFLERRK